MPRIPKPWFREQTQSWYVKINGVQHSLGKDKKAADKQYHRLMAGEGLAIPMRDLSLAGLIEQFLADSGQGHHARNRGMVPRIPGRLRAALPVAETQGNRTTPCACLDQRGA